LYCSLIARPPASIYSLSLHDALPILDCDRSSVPVRIHPRRRLDDGHLSIRRCRRLPRRSHDRLGDELQGVAGETSTYSPKLAAEDRKSTRLNSSHLVISYAVFCLKKK